MARTTILAVTDAIDTSLDDVQVGAFIDDASLWVDEHLVGEGLSTALLTGIEKYLAAHLVTLRDPRLKSAQLADVAEAYQRDGEMTEYLKAAIALDPTGKIEGAFTDQPAFSFRVGAGYDDDLDLPS